MVIAQRLQPDTQTTEDMETQPNAQLRVVEEKTDWSEDEEKLLNEVCCALVSVPTSSVHVHVSIRVVLEYCLRVHTLVGCLRVDTLVAFEIGRTVGNGLASVCNTQFLSSGGYGYFDGDRC